MKKIIKKIGNKLVVFTILFMMMSFSATAGNKTVKIKTSAVCGMCKDRIELTVNVLLGVKKSLLNDKTKVLLVRYDKKKITVAEIRKAISEAGYDADDMKKNEKAYSVLPACCKKGGSCDIKK